VRAAWVRAFDADDPAAAVAVGERPEPQPPDGWVVVNVRAASLNHHDVWSARGVGLREDQLPMILGCDAAGVDPDGREVVVHGVVNDPRWSGPEELDPKLALLSEGPQGTFAEHVAVPAANLIAKPPELSFEEAACLPTAWLTAYRMLFTKGELQPGQTVLVQGAAGGLSAALIALAGAAGLRVWVTGRSREKRAFAERLGAHATFEPGARLPERVDAVMDSVGASTFGHSLRALKRGGVLVNAGGTGGYDATVELARVFRGNLTIAGTTMGTREELARLVRFCAERSLRPLIEDTLPLAEAPAAVARMAAGDVRGKLVLSVI
jgi:NADPH:quinone reductase-like Zn-dependent oxidoreductase